MVDLRGRSSGMEGLRVVVRVPATTANLGPGFDCLGMALGLYNTVTVRVTGGGVDVRIKGEGAEALRWGEENRVLRALRLAFEQAGERLPSISLELENNIPLGRGLGSSAAATVGGLVAGNALCGNKLSNEQLLIMATNLEGHPDNVAAALLGGLIVVVQDKHRIVHSRIAVPPGLEAALYVPNFQMPTSEARRVLPQQVSRADAVYNIGRTALLTAALAHGEYGLLDIATQDRLHQPYRESILPAMPKLFEAAREAGAYGVFLSGAGSTILAFAGDNAQAVVDAMVKAGQAHDLPGRGLVAPVVSVGSEATLVQPARSSRSRH